MPNLKEWIRSRPELRDELYKKYGKSFEKTRKGEYLAVTVIGETVIGEDDGKVLGEAVEKFGSGNFVFVRVGFDDFGTWL